MDGAQALGRIGVDIPTLAAVGVDFWFGNGHKWLFSPKGSCILWVSAGFRDWTSRRGVVPSTISTLGTFEAEFAETGTRDYTPFLAFRDALSFRGGLGGDAAIMPYIRGFAWQGGQELSAAIGGTQTIGPAAMTAAMVDVGIPAAADGLSTALLADHNAFLVVYGPYLLPDETDLGYWIRLSAQIYLDL